MAYEKKLTSVGAPLVSVLVTNHNYGAFLEACVYSILEQTYANIECIVIDNASTDNSLDILDKISERKDFEQKGRSLKIVKSAVNLHQVRGGMEAFKHASGSFIIFFDADDYMLPSCVEAHIRAMLYLRFPVGATSVDMFLSRGDELVAATSSSAFSNFILSKEGQKTEFCRITDVALSRSGEELELLPSELHFVDRKKGGWQWSPTSALCFRREMIELMFMRTPSLPANLDSYLIRGVNALTGTVLIDRPLVVYRHHSSNIFSRTPALANFRCYDVNLPENDARIPAQQTINTFLSVADTLAERLEKPVIFIEAIDTLAATWPGIKPTLPLGSYVFEFLVRNEEKLKRAFGSDVYANWIQAYIRSWKDLLFIIKSKFTVFFQRTNRSGSFQHRTSMLRKDLNQPADRMLNRREPAE